MPHRPPSARSIGVTILGATGTIGVNTLDVISRHPARFHVVALTANGNVERLYEQCRAFQPHFAAMSDALAAERLADRLRDAGLETQVLAGPEGLETVAGHPQTDYVMAAIVGAAGLLPTLAAVRAGKRVLLANKEALVMAGALFMQAVRAHGAELLPIDSEHNAVFQCLPPRFAEGLAGVGVASILLTASGGPCRETPLDELPNVTPQQACRHPTWVMGRKISVDSATMMNKGLEIIEAHWLFGAQAHQIDVILHPQSIIHSMVTYVDGSVLAQLGHPDMRTPIAQALAWPERMSSGVAALDPAAIARLEFAAPDTHRFPCLALARAALEAGGTASTVLNAANEVAVEHFLNGTLAFTDIARVIEYTLASSPLSEAASLQAIVAADQAARAVAQDYIMARS